jgi:Cu(I)/Ag(I) efflux system membrane fusion protein
MKNRILTIVITAVLSIALGYFLFSSASVDETETHAGHSSAEEIWTCSMHPQIRKPEPGDCPICGMDLILADNSGSGNPLVFEMTEDAMRIANIQTTIVGLNLGSGQGLRLSGKIKTDETVASSIVTHIPGRIEKLYVSFTGDHVSKGQKIAAIYSPDLITAQRELLEAYKFKEDNPQLLEASKNKLRYWKISNQEINKIIKSGHVKEYFDIRADHSGVIQKKKIAVGDYLGKGGVLFELQNLNKLWAVFDAYEADLNSIELGKNITFTTPSIPGEKFNGAIFFIDPFINPTTRTASVRLKINNSSKRLKPEMFINGRLEQSSSENVNSRLTVPKTAVLWTGERSVVYVKVPDAKAPSFEYREVQLGATIGSEHEILEGLSVGDEVVTNGAFVIDASAQLNNQVSMMNRNLLTTQGAELSSVPDYSLKTPKMFKKQLDNLLDNYFEIKDRLVGDDLKSAIDGSTVFLKSLQQIDMSLLKGDAHMYWMNEASLLKDAITGMTEANNIAEVRVLFKQLSASLIKAMRAFGANDNDDNYVQFCSMASDNSGAYWMSTTAEIRNPYYGAQMLKCGEIKDTIN